MIPRSVRLASLHIILKSRYDRRLYRRLFGVVSVDIFSCADRLSTGPYSLYNPVCDRLSNT
jgi:hypothetical protein